MDPRDALPDAHRAVDKTVDVRCDKVMTRSYVRQQSTNASIVNLVRPTMA